MNRWTSYVWNAGRRLWLDRAGQDLIEYALMAAFLAVAVSAFLPPTIAPSISGIFSKINSLLGRA